MSFFVYKPHVESPTGATTTPDVVVDRLLLASETGPQPIPIGRLTSSLAHQIDGPPVTRPFFALTALGAGPLISPGLLLGQGLAVIARKAWRLSNLEDHAGQVTLNNVALPEWSSLITLVEQVGGWGSQMPRATIVISAGLEGGGNRAVLADEKLGRTLSHKLFFDDLANTRWPDRPKPRYSVGPTQKEVEHFY